MGNKPKTLYGNSRELLEAAERKNELLAQIAGETYTNDGNPSTLYNTDKALLAAAQKENELLEAIAEGGAGGNSANKIAIDYATDVISLKHGDTAIADSGATLPAYGLSYDSGTGGLTLTKNGTGMQGQTVALPPYGAPNKAESAEDMTDTDKVYVYVGETTADLTNGDWYVYDSESEEWVSGGVYNAEAIVTDTTLSVPGMAADAEATGDAVNDLKTKLSDYILEKTFTTVPGEFVNNSGVIRTASNFERSVPIEVLKGERYLLIATGYHQNVSMIALSNADATSTTAKVLSNGDDESVYAYEVDADGYIIVSYNNTKRCLLIKQDIMRGTDVSRVDELTEDVDELSQNVEDATETLDSITDIVRGANLCDKVQGETGFLQSNGTISTEGSYASYKTSEYIPVEVGENYVFVEFNGSTKSTERKAVIGYDAEKNKVNNTYQNINGVEYISFTAITNCVYVRVSWYASRDPMLVNGATVPNEYEAYFDPYEVVNAPLGAIPMSQIQAETVPDILKGKKWVLIGDSFSNYTNKDIDGGRFDGQDATYPRLIAERCNMNLVQTFFRDGRTLAFPAVPGTFVNSITCPTADCYYQNIPVDADYITFYIGINDEHHYTGGGDGEDPTGVITLGTIDDNTTETYYGAWNVVLTWLITNRPNAHIGIIITNGLSIADWRTAQINIARKYGIPYIDMNGDDRTPVMLRTINTDIPNSIKSALITKWAVDPTGEGGSVNTHPNWQAHVYESTFIENFMRSL